MNIYVDLDGPVLYSFGSSLYVNCSTQIPNETEASRCIQFTRTVLDTTAGGIAQLMEKLFPILLRDMSAKVIAKMASI